MAIATMDDCIESCVIQLLVDATFLTLWAGKIDDENVCKFSTIEANLRRWIDPVNMEFLRPHIESICQRFYSNNLVCLNLLLTSDKLGPAYMGNTSTGTGRDSEDGSYTNTLTLARKVSRFDLLPVPLSAAIGTTGDMPEEIGASGNSLKGDGHCKIQKLKPSRGREAESSGLQGYTKWFKW